MGWKTGLMGGAVPVGDQLWRLYPDPNTQLMYPLSLGPDWAAKDALLDKYTRHSTET